MADSSGFDLRKFQEDGEDHEKVKSIFGKILSGRDGYKTVIEKKAKKIERCDCGWVLEGCEKFCPECGSGCKEIN